jgi:peptidoglycan biosynthesis protein MviN/MurJ (putative lipid II flippase)
MSFRKETIKECIGGTLLVLSILTLFISFGVSQILFFVLFEYGNFRKCKARLLIKHFFELMILGMIFGTFFPLVYYYYVLENPDGGKRN